MEVQAPDTLEVSPEDFIRTLTQQRNAAMDEITKMSAIIAALQRKLKEKQDGKTE